MLPINFPYRLYLVISQKDCGKIDFLKVAEKAIKGGVDIIQLREKDCSTAEFKLKANKLSTLLSKWNVPLIVNDNLEVAMHQQASGIHVGNQDIAPSKIKAIWGKEKLVGYSIEYLNQLNNAEINFSDYLGISPVFNTKTKTDTVTTWGLEGVRQIRKLTNKPLVAIGNMQVNNAADVIKAGADCIAVVSAICASTDPEKTAFEFRNQIEKAL